MGDVGQQGGLFAAADESEDQKKYATASIHLEDRAALDALAERLGVELYETTESLWYTALYPEHPKAGRDGMTFCSPPSSRDGNGSAAPKRDLFGLHTEAWRNHWRGMPAFEQRDLRPWKTLRMRFPDEASTEHFEDRVGRLYHGKWCWYPPRGYETWSDQVWVGGEAETRYPIYVISKGRWESCLTMKALERMGVPYRAVVEPTERDRYTEAIGEDRLLVLPFHDLGQGSIPARNWVWEHAAERGVERYWIMDDNIDGFYRLHENAKRLVWSGAGIFRAAEAFTDRFANVALSGLQYESFAMRRELLPPYYLNTRIYSCILVNTSLPHRWRGRYNEDTDLSLRLLKDGYCTLLFNAFLANKVATMTMSGGNTDTVYAEDDNRREFAESLARQHPDCVTVTEKWGRWHHQVDYSRFRRNALRPDPDARDPGGAANEYGMELVRRPENGRAQPREDDPGATVSAGGDAGPGGDSDRYADSDLWAPPEQQSLFPDLEHDWRQEWQGMPEYLHEDLTPFSSIKVHFASRADMEAFAELVEQNVYETTQSIWYPEAEIGRYADKVYVTDRQAAEAGGEP